MSFFIFRPDGKDFCQFMTPNFPKPMFLTQISPGLVGIFFYYPNMASGLGPVALALAPDPIPNLAQARGSAWASVAR